MLPSGVTPPKTRVKLRYTDRLQITAGTTGVFTTVVYRANSAYDPYNPTGGHQPRGFAQIMAFYNHFTVIGAHMTVQYCNNVSTASSNFIGGIALRASDTHVTSFIDNTEVPRSSWKVSGRNSNNKITVKKSFNARKFFGTNSIVGESSYKGTNASGGNPTEGAYFHIFVGDVSDSIQQVVDCVVSITYDMICTEPKQIASS